MLKLCSVSKNYAEKSEVAALTGVTFAVAAGEMVAIMGPSGSGKSTLLNLMGGLDVPTSGQVLVAGTDLAEKNEKERSLFRRAQVSYIFQSYHLMPTLNVTQNVALPLHLAGQAITEIELKVAQVLREVGLAGRTGHLPDELSGGERQRVAIARALLTSPRLLLLDEPLAALDPQRKGEILPYLERLHDELQIPMLYVTHAHDEILRLADRLLLLRDGRLQACGPPAEVLAGHDLPGQGDDEVGVLLDGSVAAFDPGYQLLSLRLAGPQGLNLRLPASQAAAGTPLRCRIRARDVSVSHQRPGASSALNQLPVRLLAIRAAPHPAHALLQLEADGHPLLALITRYSLEQLQLQVGQPLWAQVKAVALN